MANREGLCPKCRGELSIPENLERFSCMYCGAVLTKEELVPKLKMREKSPLDDMLQQFYETGNEKTEALIGQMLDLDEYNPKANEIFVRLHFNEIFFNHTDAMKYFKRSDYVKYFEDYRIKNRTVLEYLERYAAVMPDRGEAFLKELSKGLVKAIDEAVAGDKTLRSRTARGLKEDEYKMILAIFVIPMVQEQKLSVGEPLADCLVEAWVSAHPRSRITKGRYEDMVSGFKKGKFCFITTAVCESFGKPDNCYELERFRAFRDQCMMKTERGRELVEEYYNIAPAIVTCIGMEEKPEQVYASIWKTWLSPCLSDLEEGRLTACGDRYEEMVRTLEKRYLI